MFQRNELRVERKRRGMRRGRWKRRGEQSMAKYLQGGDGGGRGGGEGEEKDAPLQLCLNSD